MWKLKDLIEILTWCRGAGTASERKFVEEFIATVHPNIYPDEYGNYHLTLGHEPKILWSCHTDTVTRKEGLQNVKWIGKGVLGLNNPQSGQCLGADNGAGVWIMLELIKANKPGHYVFHRDEEIGGLGSQWISKNNYVLPKSIKCAIAMDRCGTEDIITHQMYQRTASDAFANSLMLQLPNGMRKDDTGVFTDTANYVDIIGECTNLACGYERNHGPQETLNTRHLRDLRDALLNLDESKLEFERKPGEEDYDSYFALQPTSYGQGYYPRTNSQHAIVGDPAYEDDIWENHGETATNPLGRGMGHSLTEMVRAEPEVSARLLDELGITPDELRAHIYALTGRLIGA
jgi:hypothetical protein